LRTERTALAILSHSPDQPALLVAAVPLREGPVTTGALVAYTGVDDVLRPMLMSWAGFGPSAGAYLVGRDHDQTVVLSSPPAGFGLTVGARNGSSGGAFRAAAIAATGAESRIDVPDAGHEPLWAVTRFIPEIGCGLVAQARRSELEGQTSNVMAGLIALDFAMVLVVGAAVLFWRRQYEAGLARRELEVTRRHANQIQGVFDNAFDGILSFDRRGMIRTANPAAENVF